MTSLIGGCIDNILLYGARYDFISFALAWRQNITVTGVELAGETTADPGLMQKGRALAVRNRVNGSFVMEVVFCKGNNLS